MSLQCYCGSNAPFGSCCEPLITGIKQAASPEALMRSRYSAYVVGNYDYILNTYASSQRQELSVEELSQASQGTKWLKLVVKKSEKATELPLQSLPPISETSSTVTFSAYYKVGSDFYKLHECSSFVQEDNAWRYTTGQIFDDSGLLKPQRNAPCFCGSGNKFKRCCGK